MMPAHQTMAIGRLGRVSRSALQWRLMVLWMLALLLPTALMAVPFWRILASQLDHSVHAARWAQQLDALVIADLLARFAENGMVLAQAGVTALVLTLLLSPLLSASVLVAARSEQPPGFFKLIQGGVQEYPRMLRMLLWAAVPLGLAIALGAGGLFLAKKFAASAILESDAEWVGRAALALLALLVLLALTSVDAARAQLAFYHRRPSVVQAWWRGCRVVRQRALSMLGCYLLISLVGLGLAAALTTLRLALPGWFWFGFGLVLAQFAVAAIVWMRIARLLVLIDLSRP